MEVLFRPVFNDRPLTSEERRTVNGLLHRFRRCYQEYESKLEFVYRIRNLPVDKARIKGKDGYYKLTGFQLTLWKLEVDILQSLAISSKNRTELVNTIRDLSRHLYKEYAPFAFSAEYRKTLSQQGALSPFACKSLRVSEFLVGTTQGVFGSVMRTALRQPHEAVQLAPLLKVVRVALCESRPEADRVRIVRDYLHKLILCDDSLFPSCQSFFEQVWKTVSMQGCCVHLGQPGYSVLADCCAWTKVKQTMDRSEEAQRRVNRLWNKILGILRSIGWAMFRKQHKYKGETPDYGAYPMLYHNVAHDSFYKGLEYLERETRTSVQKYYAISSLLMILLAIGHEQNTIRNIIKSAEFILLHRHNQMPAKTIVGLVYIINAFTACMEFTSLYETALIAGIRAGTAMSLTKLLTYLLTSFTLGLEGSVYDATQGWSRFMGREEDRLKEAKLNTNHNRRGYHIRNNRAVNVASRPVV